MHLNELRILSAPGLPHGTTLDGFAPGLNLLVGPNASGKSTAGRAMLASLGLGAPDPGVHALLRWHDDGQDHTATLFDGRVAGELGGVDASSSGSNPWTLTLRDLLAADDVGFAQRMTTELHAGFDVPALVDQYQGATRTPRALRKRVDDARRDEQQVAATQRALAGEEKRLGQLDAAIEHAAGATNEIAAIDAALAWRDAQHEVEIAAAVVADFDPLHARIQDGFDERLADHDDAVERTASHARSARAAHDAARAALDALGDGASKLDRAAVDALDERVRAIEAATAAVEQRAEAQAIAAAAVDAARGHAGLSAEATAPTAAALEAIETHVRAEADARARLAEARATVDGLETFEAPGDLAALRDAIVVLRQWLQANAGAASEPTPRGDRRVSVAAVVAAIVIVVIGAVTGGLIAGLVGAVALVGVAVATWPRVHQTASRPHQPTWSFDIDPPDAWTIEAVSNRALALHAVVAEREVKRARAEQVAALRTRSTHRLEDAEQQARTATGAVSSALIALGLDPEMARTGAVEMAHRLRAIADATADLAAATTAAREARGALDRAWTAWSTACQQAGATWTGARDVVDARAHAARLRDAADTRDRVERDVQTAAQAADAADQAAEQAIAARDRLFAGAGFGDDERSAVRDCFATHAAWREAATALDDARRAETRARAAIDTRDDLAVLSAEALRQRRDVFAARAAELEGLMAERAALRERVQQALGGSARADAADAVAHASAELAARRDEALVAATAAAMAQHIARTLDRTAVPDALARAQRRFAAFTRGAWTLVLRPDRTLGARDEATGAVRSLDALSDATRVQLLLATRIARIETLETGAPRPLFIDEALTTTDPMRFAAVADALATLADDGRQVIYATAAPAEVDAWRAWARERGRGAPTIVETGVIASERAWPRDLPGAPAPPDTVPDPGADEAPEAWFGRAGVALPTLHDPASAWPAAALLYDRLDAAAALLRERVGTVGQALSLIESGASWLPLDDNARDRFVARAQLLDAALTALAIGRHRAVDASVIEASDTITSTWDDRVRALLQTHGHDAAAFAAAVRDLPRFRSATADRLDEYLRDEGYIDDREPLDAIEVIARVRAAARPDAAVDGAEVESLVRWVTTVLERGTAG